MPKRLEPRKYAEGTTVAVDKSRSELEALLRKHGASEFAFFSKEEGENRGAQIMFRMDGMLVRQRVLYPLTGLAPNTGHLPQSYVKSEKREAEYRRRWRALVLITKAKLEIIAGGESTFQREFMPDIMLPDGKTVAEVLVPQLVESYANGNMPLMLGSGG